MHFRHPARRLRFFAALISTTLLLLTGASVRAEADVQLGLQTWTLRNMKLDQAVEFAVKHGIKKLQMSVHMDPMASKEEVLRVKGILDKNGLSVYTFGVAATSLDKEKNRKLFETARLIGASLIIVEPPDFKIFDNLEELVKEYDIRIAVHNHGIRSLYGNPAVLKNILQHRDRRMGVCLDTGWITAAGFSAAKVFKDYEGRVFDIHLKDKKVEPSVGDPISTDTFIGQGNATFSALFAELKKADWKGVMAIETDSPIYAQNPEDFVKEAKKYFESSVK